MPRPKIPRRLRFSPNVFYYKPRGIPLKNLQEVNLLADELEAVKLYDADGLDQLAASKKMRVSQPTFARIVASAHKKIAVAITKGYAIRINKKSDDK